MYYYTFNPITNEYTGTRIPQIDPLESKIQNSTVYTLPGQFETVIPPPEAPSGNTIVWTGTSWGSIKDHRGEIWYNGAVPVIIDSLGVPLGLTTQPPELSIETLRVNKMNSLVSEFNQRVNTDYTAVTTTAGKYNYGIDDSTRQNFQMALLGVVSGIITESREWTPKGRLQPIVITTQDILLLAGTVGNSYDSYVKSYLSKKATVMQLTDRQEIMDYDLTINWPVLTK